MMQTLDLHLLGSPRLAGKPLLLSKSTALMAYLVLQNKWVARDELLYLFYPNSTETEARNNLRQLVLRLKSDWLAFEIDSKTSKVRLIVQSDVQDFKTALESKNISQAAAFSGVLLEGVHLADAPEFMDWLELERNALQLAWQKNALQYARQAESFEAGKILKQILQKDALCEEAVQIFLERGELSQAKLVFQTFAKAIGELGLQPHPKTLVLLEQLTDFSQVVTVHNLPFSTTPFVGREQQLRALHEIIEHPMSRLITVVGLGGMGKTRLALQAAHTWLEAGFDGVYLVTLADLQDISGLPNAIASAMNIPIYTDAKTEVLSLLQSKRVLLLLDNFEHLTLETPRGFLYDLLEQCASLKVLVTSRVPLQIYGEWLFNLQGFESGDSAATQLFWQTAQRHNPRLEMSDQSSAWRIVERLGGMPLAIELAAYWTRLLSPAQVLHELELGLKLETKSIAVPERQRAIEVMLEQSYQRLTTLQQTTLQAMCVFRGGATLEAARAVTSGSLEDLQHLVETGLLQKNSLGRFDLHELLRQYVLTQVQPADLADFRQKQGQYFSELLLRSVKAIEKNYASGVAAITLEYPNIEMILGFFTRFDLEHEFARIADFYLVFLRVRGLFWTALDFIEANIKNPDLSLGVVQQNQIIKACILQCTFQLEASKNCFQETLPTLEPLDPTWGYGWLGYSETLLLLGEAQEARVTCQRAFTAFETTDLYFYLLRVKILTANAYLYSAEPLNAKTQALEALHIAQQYGISYSYGSWYWEVGKIFIALQEPDTLKYLQGTFEFYQGIFDTYSLQFIAREAKNLYLANGQVQNHDWVDNFLVELV